MVDISDAFKGAFMNIDTTEDGDIATITSEGELVEMLGKFSNKMERKLNLDVEIDGTKMIWTPWDKNGRELQAAFGMDTKQWVGKKLSILHIDKRMVVRPIVVEKQ